MNNFLPTIKELVAKYKLSLAKDKTKDIHELLCKYMETLIFNIVSIASIITMINNSDTIKTQTLTLVKSYINDKCNHKMTGGSTGMPSEYYGIDSGIYSENNASGDILNIDFASGMLRPQIGGGGRGSNYTINQIFMNKIHEILNYYRLKSSDSINNSLLKLIYMHINCFFKELKASRTTLNIASINKIIKSNKNLDIFK
jgi:hypothetical protein